MYYLQSKDYVQCLADMTRHTAENLQHYKKAEHVDFPISLLSAKMTSSTCNRSTTIVAASAKRWRGKRTLPTLQEEQQLPGASSSSAYSDIYKY